MAFDFGLCTIVATFETIQSLFWQSTQKSQNCTLQLLLPTPRGPPSTLDSTHQVTDSQQITLTSRRAHACTPPPPPLSTHRPLGGTIPCLGSTPTTAGQVEFAGSAARRSASLLPRESMAPERDAARVTGARLWRPSGRHACARKRGRCLLTRRWPPPAQCIGARRRHSYTGRHSRPGHRQARPPTRARRTRWA